MASKSDTSSTIVETNKNDEIVLERLGYKQVLHRSYSLFKNFSTSFAALYLVGGVRVTFSTGIAAGGPLAYCRIKLPLGRRGGRPSIWPTIRIYRRIVEYYRVDNVLCKQYPIHGQLYAIKLTVFELDFPTDTGNIKFRALQWICTEVMLALAAWINLASLFRYVFWFSTAAVFLDFILNLIWLPLGAHNTYGLRTAHEAFMTTYNGIGAPAGWDWCLSYLATAGILIGFDASGHVAEETKNASLNAAKGIFLSTVISGVLGFSAVILFLFTSPPIEVLFSYDAPQSFVPLYAAVLGRGGHIVMNILSIVALWLNTAIAITAASRLVFAVARDGVLPFSAWTSRVSEGLRISHLFSEEWPGICVAVKDLKAARHIVGWCPEMKLYAGQRDASYSIENTALLQVIENDSFITSDLSTGEVVTDGTNLALGQREIGGSRTSFFAKIKWLSQHYVVLWDVGDQRGWLVNGPSALLHLVRASIREGRGDRNTASVREDQLLEAKAAYQWNSAFHHLSHPLNRRINIALDGEAGKREAIKQPRSFLDGWDFRDLVLEKDRIHLRRTVLEPEDRSWVDLTRSICAPALSGRGYGDLVLPAKRPHSDALWTRVPTGKYYLAASAEDITELMKTKGNEKSTPIKLTSDIVWCVAKSDSTPPPQHNRPMPESMKHVHALLPYRRQHEARNTATLDKEAKAWVFGPNENDPWQLGPQYGHPGLKEDRISQWSPSHPYPVPDCNPCFTTFEVQRTPRGTTHPRIHYGLIISGREIITVPEARDELGQRYGALCYETEAAGIMSIFPCMLIRGAADYADTHRHLMWQRWAAATAAAYSKLFLTRLSGVDVHGFAGSVYEGRGCRTSS
ncbi:uncharacterized protein BP01DRAFT_392394 [Aspergillus saccharolyticus JOP 1030-1]|uniref:Amino acid permease/ SLC12A domain-containing protein n=1 Tax=Aspergillus saccharolyticus JOP 1030-1 TaxID=1450539 RepID=A0A318ZJM0_9EURO|nr:hypothetical protein BP01DRAFT_392394 [Aspergillus saccharolyticus JOP 1030-1]PYH44753.1 hypothetical protein BP01DRAFT_392394 [Aspergillus saccharolyticus JOP 1030-1]